MSGTGSLLDVVQLADTLGTAGVRSPQVSVLWGTIKHIRQGSRTISLLHSSGQSKAVSRLGMSVQKLSLYTPAGRKAAAEGEGDWERSIIREFPIQIEAPIKKILRRLQDRGIVPTEMELILEKTQQGISHEVLKDSILQAGNSIKEILLKLNIPDHRSILMDSKVTPTKHGRIKKQYSTPRFIANCFNVGYLNMEVKVPDSSCLKDS
nr:maturase, mitochondrial [Tanacetum cinerariifolium]